CLRCLRKDPADRYASAGQLADDLHGFRAGRPAPGGAPPVAPPLAQEPGRLSRRFWLAGAAAAALAVGGLALARRRLLLPAGPPLRIGLLHSLTGTMALSERPVVEAERLAIEELNRAGGVLGRPLEPIVADGRSRESIFAREAERLIVEEDVSVL